MKKVSLKSLEVKSFVTDFNNKQVKTIKGGGEASLPQGPCEEDSDVPGITYTGCRTE